MLYISKGMLLRTPVQGKVFVSRCGMEHGLSDKSAQLWLKGRFYLAEADNSSETNRLDELVRLGLVETDDEQYRQTAYRLLANCIICPAKLQPLRPMLNKMERRVWQWISQSGFRLTISELVFLIEHEIKLLPSLIGLENRQNLTEVIYTSNNIQDGVLLTQMESAPACTITVDAVLSLLRKKRVLLI